MKRSEVSVNYVLVLGLEAALAVLLGTAWLDEALSLRRLAGLALILAGIISLRMEARSEAAPTTGEGPYAVSCRLSAGAGRNHASEEQ
jgi:threonine/homoserine efflux transporter RhtA